MSCLEIIGDYAFRSLGFGERLLPRSDFTLCHQVTLIGSGLIWNIYFGALALLAGFFLANAVALVRPLFMDQWPVNVIGHGSVLLAYAVVSFWVALGLTRKRFGQ